MTDDREVMDPLTRGLVLALPLAFLAHDLGEVAGNDDLNDALVSLAGGLPVLRRLGVEKVARRSITTQRQLAVAVGLLAGALTAVSVRAAVRPPRTAATAHFAVATGLVGGHLAGHVVQSLLLRRPMPGLTGGLAVTVPYSAAVLLRLRRRGYLEDTTIARDAIAPAAAFPLLLLGVRALARRLA
jgi:hypothetical protein